jgi:hypothetical protein
LGVLLPQEAASRDCTFVNKLILTLSALIVDCSLPTAALVFSCEAAIIILRVSYVVVACLLFIFVF